jgi:hypothetical protein
MQQAIADVVPVAAGQLQIRVGKGFAAASATDIAVIVN